MHHAAVHLEEERLKSRNIFARSNSVHRWQNSLRTNWVAARLGLNDASSTSLQHVRQ